MRKRAYHVVPNYKDGGWAVLLNVDAPEENLVRYNSQEAAVGYAQKMSLTHDADLVVHDPQGQVSWEMRRKDNGVELVVRDESQVLPGSIREAMAENLDIRGIPHGQIQPKHPL